MDLGPRTGGGLTVWANAGPAAIDVHVGMPSELALPPWAYGLRGGHSARTVQDQPKLLLPASAQHCTLPEVSVCTNERFSGA